MVWSARGGSEGSSHEVTESDAENNARIPHCNIQKTKRALTGPFVLPTKRVRLT